MPSEEDEKSGKRVCGLRRQFLQGIGAAGVTGVLAGCLGGDDEDGENGDDENGDDENGDDGNGENGDGDNGDDPEPAVFEVSDLDPEEATVTRGDGLEVAATVENTGDEEGTRTVELLVDGDAVESTDVSLDGGDSEEVSFSIEGVELDAGEYEHAVVTEDDEATGTLTVEALLEEPDELLTFGDNPRVATGTGVLSGTVENPYGVAVEDGEVGLDVPDGWEVVGEDGTEFDSIDAGESQNVTWELEVPEDSDGEHELEAEVSYAALGEEAEVSITVDVTTFVALSAPIGLDLGGSHTEETVEIDGLEFLPTPEQSAEIAIDGENRPLEEDEIFWPDALSITPDPNESPGATSEDRPLNSEVDEPLGVEPDIEGTEHDSLYWTEQWGNGELNYHFGIESGVYEVTLHFAEVWFADEETRVFSGSVNGETLFEELDLYADYGPDTAVTFTHVTEVEDNELVVSLESSVENPKISGIEIREADLETGMVGHYDASALELEDGDAVSEWPDAGGAGPALTQDDEDAQPTFHDDVANGNSTVRFEGDGDYINADDVATEDTAGVTMVAAFSTHDVTVSRQTVLFNGSDGDLNGYGIFVNNEETGEDPASEGFVHALYGGVNWWWSDTTAVEEQFHVVTLTIPQDAPDQPVLRFDGQELNTELQLDPAAPETPSAQFGIGYDDGAVEDRPPYFHGDMGEAMIYDRELTESELQELESQIGDKWGADVDHQPSGLVGHWSFAEENVDGSTVMDASGNGHDGEIPGDVTTGLDAPVGGAAEFVGEEDSTVLVPDADALNPPEYTVSTWARTDGTGDWTVLVGKEESFWCGTLEDTAIPRLDPHDDPDVGEFVENAETAIDDGEWHHVVYRHAPSNGRSTIHIDGQQEGLLEDTTESGASENPLGIASKSNSADHFTGEIADVRLYERPLSEDEIVALYEDGA